MNTPAPTAYPLQWPAGWVRTALREKAAFKTNLSAALKALATELRLMGATNLVLSSNCTLGTEAPADPGVVAYFVFRKQNLAIPCDRWNRVCDNVRAIALTVEAMRGMERWGAKAMISAMFRGFLALPSTQRHWTEILGLEPTATKEAVNEKFRELAAKHHPDRGGESATMALLTEARTLALKDIGA